jgi:hypothetical protein
MDAASLIDFRASGRFGLKQRLPVPGRFDGFFCRFFAGLLADCLLCPALPRCFDDAVSNRLRVPLMAGGDQTASAKFGRSGSGDL